MTATGVHNRLCNADANNHFILINTALRTLTSTFEEKEREESEFGT